MPGIAALALNIAATIITVLNHIAATVFRAGWLGLDILVISAYCCFVDMGIISCVPVIIILFREFAVTSVRLVAASKGKVVAANIWGKAKTVSQIVVVILVILLLIVSRFINNEAVSSVFYIIDNAAVWISVLFTVFSGVIYLKDNSDIYTTMK